MTPDEVDAMPIGLKNEMTKRQNKVITARNRAQGQK